MPAAWDLTALVNAADAKASQAERHLLNVIDQQPAPLHRIVALLLARARREPTSFLLPPR